MDNKMMNKEATKHMEEIWRENNDPVLVEKKVARIKKEQRQQEKEEDLGI